MWKTFGSSSREACMPVEPLSDEVVARLRSDPTAALAAVLVVNASFPNIVSWAARAFGEPSPPRGPVGGGNGANGGDDEDGNDSPPRRRQSSDRADQQLLALMRQNKGASIARLTELSGRSRSLTVLSLKRLEEAGLVDHGGHGSWAAVDDDSGSVAEDDPDLVAEGSPLPQKTGNWVAPLSGKQVAGHTAGGRVRDGMATACSL
jgi:hypothetical protein